MDLDSFQLGDWRMEDFSAQRISKMSVHFEMDRSSSLFRVRSSDRYQTKAALGLYFLVQKKFFVFGHFSFSKFGENKLTLDQISDQFHCSGCEVWCEMKEISRIIKKIAQWIR